MLPIVGHLGIVTVCSLSLILQSDGTIHDFGGPYWVNVELIVNT